MFRPDGVFICTDAEGRETHTDSYQCGHCGMHNVVRTKTRDTDIGGWCRVCTSNVCPRCLVSGRCDPFEKAIERVEARAMALRSYGLAG
ncbi:hypothetical protein [Rhodopseudomonas sp. RCAM05734]|uniref:hypothetical protein n=1 Tax=Rhodopseudomonas sp. RCAM05734 TaxID=3457549 RepID=UPI004045032B